jgi:putative ABC transport system ATP-binding protein
MRNLPSSRGLTVAEEHGDHRFGLTALRSDSGAPLGPLVRLRRLAALEREDLWVVVIYAAAAGLVSLAVPIAAQSLVNTVAFAALLQPLVVLTIFVLVGLSLWGFTSTLQQIVIERLNQRFFVRTAHDVAGRLLDADVAALRGRLAPDLTNRFFDVVVVQKAASTLLVDGLSAVLQSVLSLLLLAFYHPALLAFDLVLLGCIAFVLFGLGRGGVDTAIKESKVKHQTGAWLEQLASSLVAFKGPRAAAFAFQRTDALARNYVGARSKHFRVLLRQIIASQVLQALATAVLLGLGGALVIRGQLTLGQLVAAELAVAGVLASVAKSSKSLANYYDINAAIDKVGSLIDLPSERRRGVAVPRREGPAVVALTDAGCDAVDGGYPLRHLSFKASHGAWLAVLGDDCDGRQTLVSLLYGVLPPSSGRVELDGSDIRNLSLDELRADITLVAHTNLFDGSVAENLSWGEPLDAGRSARVLELLELTDVIGELPDGLATRISSGEHPLTEDQALRLTLARALFCQPRVLLLDCVLDVLGLGAARKIVSGLAEVCPGVTVIAFTRRPEIAALFSGVLRLSGGGAESPREAA